MIVDDKDNSGVGDGASTDAPEEVSETSLMVSDKQELARTQALPPLELPVENGSLTFPWVAIFKAENARQMLNAYRRACVAYAEAQRAQADLSRAVIERERAVDALRHIDDYKEIDRLDRETQKKYAETRLARAEADLELEKLDKTVVHTTPEEDSEALVDVQKRIQELRDQEKITHKVEAEKKRIIEEAGGEENLSDAQRELIEELDELLFSAISMVRAGYGGM